MKRKIVCILVMTLLIITVALPLVPSITISNISSLGEVKDQSQEVDDGPQWLGSGMVNWQEFTPSKIRLVRIELKIMQGYAGSPDLNMEIMDPVGTVIASHSVPAIMIPEAAPGWVSFDFADVDVHIGNIYTINVWFDPGAEYAWCGASGNKYTAGESDRGAMWDWCFRTFADDNLPPSTPSINGPTSGKKGDELEYRFVSTDPDGDDISYRIQWGCDDPEILIGPFPSGEEQVRNHTYAVGDYTIQIKARDSNGAESDWGTLDISVPKTKSTETEIKKNDEIDSMMFCDILIKGSANVQVIRGSFILGFGKCFYMKVDLENDGSLEISSITNPSNSVELEGSHQIHLIGFGGFYSHLIKTRIDGKALLAIWG